MGTSFFKISQLGFHQKLQNFSFLQRRFFLQIRQFVSNCVCSFLGKFNWLGAVEKIMDSIIKKYQQKFRKIKAEMSRWEELQSRIVSQFSNASSIIQRLQVIQDSRNYGVLKCVEGIEDAVLAKQMESLQAILLSMNNTLEEFNGVVSSLEKVVRDSKQLMGMGSAQLTAKQLKQRIGIKPSLADCLDGLRLLEEMHQSEYRLKLSVVSALPAVALNPSASGDLGALQQVLVDQPNVPQEQVQFIYDIIFAEEIS